MLIIPLVGLAVDLSMLYLIRARLISAADAAVLAGARGLGRGSTLAAQRVSAQTAAAKFFHANFPAGYWGSTNLSFPSVTVDDSSTPNYRTVTATASVQAPLYFLRILGQQFSTLTVSAQAARRDALVILVLDRSSSMNGVVAGTGQSACSIMKADAVSFVEHFAPGRDQIGLVVFNGGQYTYQARTDFTTPDAKGKTVASVIQSITCNGNTASAEALHAAYAELQRVNSSSRANVIVFMTDGRPNGVTGDFINHRISPCGTTGTPMIGVLAQWAGNAPTGQTAGLLKRTLTDVTSDGTYSTENTANCKFRNDLKNIAQDVSRMPSTDVYGNSLSGPYYTGVNLTSVSLPQEITKASSNALDNQATVIRTNTTLKPMIYTIGLQGVAAATDQPDDLLLMKVANDPQLAQEGTSGPVYYQAQKNQPRGIYVIAPDATQLQSAFDTIATHIVVRLSL
jgi:Flp pilus assembly protein TadG